MAEKQSTPKTLEKYLKHNPTKTLQLSDIFLQKNLQKWPIKVNFRGWRKPRQKWVNWVEKLSPKYAKIWELTGICGGILSSLHKIKPNPEIILALSEFWCSKTNTFIFPWGEATITLKDVNVLYGLPVLGETVNFSLFEASSKHMEEKLQQVKDDLSTRTNESKAWITYFNQEKDEIEHVGFLAYWLSMFVFPDLNDRRVGKHVFSIAVHLARGEKIALAPAVLACLYQNLTFITHHAADIDSATKEVSVPGAFQIVQLWALERFPFLGSKLAEPLSLGQPRIARWDKVRLKGSLVDLRNALRSSGDSFCWRPYCSNLENWQNRSSAVFMQPQGANDDNDSCDSDDLPLALRLCSKARIGERLVGRQESGKPQPGVKVKSPCVPPLLMLKPCENKDDYDSSDSDNLPLSLRLHSNAVIKKVALRNKKIRVHTSAAVKSPLIKIKRSSDPNGRKGVSTAKKRVASDSLDIDHVPLAMRLQSIARSVGTLTRKRVASDSLDIDHVPLALRLESVTQSVGTFKQLKS
ncbi:hypothetical protein BVRB_4g091300 [Beta vulgaris subsp. vulgaris]|nr:hypothetical protein BVRB_4g091300 [Beta vulgaris subsp. vulgaris]